jgi:hypothetical protein
MRLGGPPCLFRGTHRTILFWVVISSEEWLEARGSRYATEKTPRSAIRHAASKSIFVELQGAGPAASALECVEAMAETR